MLKGNNKNTRTHLVLMFLLLTLNMQFPVGRVELVTGILRFPRELKDIH